MDHDKVTVEVVCEEIGKYIEKCVEECRDEMPVMKACTWYARLKLALSNEKKGKTMENKIPQGWKVAKSQFIPFAARAAVAVNGKIRYVGASYKIAHPEVICVERV